LALQYSISPGQVCDILKGSERWISTDPNSHQAKLIEIHILPAAKIYEPLILWIEKALECNLTIAGSIIQQKALRFAELLNYNESKAFKSLKRKLGLLRIKNQTQKTFLSVRRSDRLNELLL